MKTGWAVAYGSVLGLLIAGLIFWILSKPARSQAIELLPVPTAAPHTVYIDGAVQNPGLYSLPPGSRVSDAIKASGGVLPGADLKTINPARLVEEGERIYVPLEPAAVPAGPTAVRSNPLPLASGTPAQNPVDTPTPALLLVNVNIATQAELESLPRIGPVTAQAIIVYRNSHGPFKTLEELMDVSGIGPATLEALRPYITLGE